MTLTKLIFLENKRDKIRETLNALGQAGILVSRPPVSKFYIKTTQTQTTPRQAESQL
jgi:hypothetical protein